MLRMSPLATAVRWNPILTIPTVTPAAAADQIVASDCRSLACISMAGCGRSSCCRRKLHVSRKLDFEQLALVETLAIGRHAVCRAAPKPEETCLIIGVGPIGLSVLEFVKLAGSKVILLDMNSDRLDFCRRVMGVPHTLKPSGRIEDDLRELTDGHLPDVVFDATGSSKSMSQAFNYVSQGGRLVFVGLTGDEVSFRHAVFHKCEGTLLCSRNALPDDFRQIISLIETGRIDTRPWITHRCGFDELIEQFPSYTQPETGVIKAMVDVGT